jgi:hypothetical protein
METSKARSFAKSSCAIIPLHKLYCTRANSTLFGAPGRRAISDGPAVPCRVRFLSVCLVGLAVVYLQAGEADERYPLDAQLKVLADDVKNEKYRRLVLAKMLITDLAAEWQRVATADNPDPFCKTDR